MKRCAITPFEGNEPFIFVSYAHKDSAKVFPVLEELSRRGYRIWYDDGIAPGSEWPENIARHLSACALTLAFISPNSIASANCRREVTFALSKQKPFLAIILEPTEMSLGMEMQLSAQQCVMKYTYTSDEDFYHKLCSCPDMAPCLSAQEPPVEERPAPAPDPRPAPEKKPAPAPKTAKPFPLWIPIVIAAVLVVALIVGIALGGGSESDPQNTDSLSTDPLPTETQGIENSITIEGETVNQETLETIRSQAGLEAVIFRSCNFESGVLAYLELPELVSFTAVDCTGVDDLTGFSEMEALQTLILENCDVTDAVLATLTHKTLKELSVSGCSAVTDITPLASMTKLESLSAARCSIAAIDGEFQCLRLKKLDLSHNQLEDASAFANCTVLTHADLSWNNLNYVEYLGKNAATLKVLNLSMNTRLSKYDLDFVSQCTALEELYLDCTSLYELDFLEPLQDLRVLSANNCAVSDITSLSDMKDLTYIGLALNSIEDLSALSGLTGTDVVLDLGLNNYIQDVSGLPAVRYTCLNLLGEDVDLSKLPKLEGGALVVLFSETLIEDAQRFAGFDSYILVNCPSDRRVAVEDLLGIDAVTFVDDEIAYVEAMMELGLDYSFALTE